MKKFKGDYALSDEEIKNLVKPDSVDIITYDKLGTFKRLDDVFKKSNNVVILFRFEPHAGHWVLLMKHNENLVEYFDSYGKIDFNLLNEKNLNKELGQYQTYLSELLLHWKDQNKKNKVDYNQIRFQDLKKGFQTSTCGRYVIYRIRNRDVPLKDFQKLFNLAKKKKINLDELVIKLTNENINFDDAMDQLNIKKQKTKFVSSHPKKQIERLNKPIVDQLKELDEAIKEQKKREDALVSKDEPLKITDRIARNTQLDIEEIKRQIRLARGSTLLAMEQLVNKLLKNEKVSEEQANEIINEVRENLKEKTPEVPYEKMNEATIRKMLDEERDKMKKYDIDKKDSDKHKLEVLQEEQNRERLREEDEQMYLNREPRYTVEELPDEPTPQRRRPNRPLVPYVRRGEPEYVPPHVRIADAEQYPPNYIPPREIIQPRDIIRPIERPQEMAPLGEDEVLVEEDIEDDTKNITYNIDSIYENVIYGNDSMTFKVELVKFIKSKNIFEILVKIRKDGSKKSIQKVINIQPVILPRGGLLPVVSDRKLINKRYITEIRNKLVQIV